MLREMPVLAIENLFLSLYNVLIVLKKKLGKIVSAIPFELATSHIIITITNGPYNL